MRTRHGSSVGRGTVCENLLTPVSNPVATAAPPRTLNLYLRAFTVCQKNFIRRIDQVTDKVSNSPAQTRTEHQVSTPFPFIALAPPSFPSRPGSSILMDDRSEGSLTVDNSARRWTSNDIRSRCRRMSFGQYHATTAE
jgi:hypothetical protein